MSSWVRSACYPQSTFYPLSDGPSIQNRRITLAKGNDLITPMPQYNFPGLKAGDCWCLCALRWKEAFDAGVAPPVNLDATHEKALEFASLDQLKSKALD